LWLVRAICAPVAAFRFLFLDPRGIREHLPEQVGGGRGAPDRAGKAFRREAWKQAAMIDMGVGEQHGVYLRRVEGEGLMIEGLERSRTLEEATVDQQSMIAAFDLEARSGDGLCRAVNGEPNSGGHVQSTVSAIAPASATEAATRAAAPQAAFRKPAMTTSRTSLNRVLNNTGEARARPI
jgi:hypothetical protein